MNRSQSADGAVVSVLIPSYNHEKFILKCLDSCLGQMESAIEILLLDDGSTDRTFELACAWKRDHESEFVRILAWTRPNQGVCRTLNELIGKASGTYIAMLASDDALLPGSIRQRVEALEANPDKLAVFGDAIPIDADDKVLGSSCLTGLGVKSNINAFQSSKFLITELLLRWNGSGPVFMARRKTYNPETGIGLYDEEIFFEDRDIYLRLAASGKLIFINKIIAQYRISDASLSRNAKYAERMRHGMLQSNRKALSYTSGSARWILWLLVIGGEGRYLWKPRLLYYPVWVMAELAKRLCLVVHDLHVKFHARMGGRIESAPQ